MRETAFCLVCSAKQPYGIMPVDEEFNIRGVKCECTVYQAFCKMCGNELYVPRINDVNCKIRRDTFEKGRCVDGMDKR